MVFPIVIHAIPKMSFDLKCVFNDSFVFASVSEYVFDTLRSGFTLSTA